MSDEDNVGVHYTVFVLGEIGRSPRMQYHALSLAKLSSNNHVDLVGYEGPQPHTAIIKQFNITLIAMNTSWYNWTQQFMRKHFALFLLFAPIKILIQFVALLFTLLFFTSTKKKNVILVQNPPAIPTLMIIPLYVMLMRIVTLGRKQYSLVIDWHNYAHTLMVNVSYKPDQRISFLKKLILKLATALEMNFGRWFGNEHLCVSEAMKKDLKQKYNINATVLYDRPPKAIFRKESLSLEEKHDLFRRVFPDNVETANGSEKTLFTKSKNDMISTRKHKPGLVVSSTSWTADEDFSILLNAIQIYDERQTKLKNPKRLQLIITGSGPLKAFYEEKIRNMTLQYCSIHTKWLEAEDYPKLLSCCDLGVCLHYSSSGVDLPMKVVDMFGSSIPVCAIDFQALPELVKDKQNGYIFETSEQLADQLYQLFVEDPDHKTIDKMKQHIQQNFQKRGWNEEWSEKALPVLRRLTQSNQ
jgi:beta-1,4-mannosyltransferase